MVSWLAGLVGGWLGWCVMAGLIGNIENVNPVVVEIVVGVKLGNNKYFEIFYDLLQAGLRFFCMVYFRVI